MTADPAGIPAMTMTATGYRLVSTPDATLGLLVQPRPAHRATMTAEQAQLCLMTRAYQRRQPEHGAHYVAAFTPHALLAEYNARLTAYRDVA